MLRDGGRGRRAPRPAVRDAGREPRPVDGGVADASSARSRPATTPSRCRCRPCCRSPTRSTSRATRRCPRSWARSASRTRCCRWPTPASTPARVGSGGSRTGCDGLSTPPARGDSHQDRGRRHRRREDPGLPRRAEGGGLMAGILVFAELPGRRVLEGLAGPARGGRPPRCARSVGARARAGLRRRVDDATAAAARRPRRRGRARRGGRRASASSQPVVDARRRAAGDRVRSDYLLFGASIVASDAAAGIAVRLDAGLVIDAVELHDRGRRARHPARRPRRLGARALRLHDARRRGRRARQHVRRRPTTPPDRAASRCAASRRACGRSRPPRTHRRARAGRRSRASTSARRTCSSAAAAASASPRTSALCEDLASGARRCRRRDARGRRRRLVPVRRRRSARPARRVSPKLLHRVRHLRRDPAQGRHAGVAA